MELWVLKEMAQRASYSTAKVFLLLFEKTINYVDRFEAMNGARFEGMRLGGFEAKKLEKDVLASAADGQNQFFGSLRSAVDIVQVSSQALASSSPH